MALLQRSWVVFVHAAVLSIESIVIEILTTDIQISPLKISSTSITIAGAVLLLIIFLSPRKKRRVEELAVILRAWKHLVPSSVFLAAGVFTWYGSVSRIGASKEGLIAGPLEIIFIIFLAFVFLHERLGRTQLAGIVMAISGFFVTVLSGAANASLVNFGAGDFEAVLSAASFALGIIMLAKLTEKLSSIEVTGSSFFISGIILTVIFWIAEKPSQVTGHDLLILALFSLLPLAAALLYVIGLSRIGASLTSTIASSSILLTVVFQIILAYTGIIQPNLPERIPIAMAGGVLGILGIYLMHTSHRNSDRDGGKNQVHS